MSVSPQLFVKSHVARDLLQNAGLFKTDKLVVWEYVSNGLQYISAGTSPVVKVVLDSKKKRIAIQDNGRGMDWAGLQNFFVMHGENQDRKEGRIGRGMFGTGKSAAFGIAGLLRITSVRNGKRSKVELKRSEIEKMKSDDPISVTVIEQEIPTSATNGTLVEIEGVHNILRSRLCYCVRSHQQCFTTEAGPPRSAGCGWSHGCDGSWLQAQSLER